MEITQMRYFLEVAKTQHITQSAQSLHIAQPALSQAIHRMEKELGVPLFVSKGRNIVLTEYGKYLQTQLEAIINRLDSIPTALKKMADENYETIHLSVGAASTMVTNAVVDYQASHSSIHFKMLQNSQDDMFDIEITTNVFSKTSLSGENKYICPERIFLAVPDNEKFKNKNSIALSDVENEDFISLMGSKQFRFICDKFCRHAGINPKITFESDSPQAVKNMIGANLGVGFWPEFTWGRLESNAVKLLQIDDTQCSRDIIITCLSPQNKNVLNFYNYLKEYFDKQKTLSH